MTVTLTVTVKNFSLGNVTKTEYKYYSFCYKYLPNMNLNITIGSQLSESYLNSINRSPLKGREGHLEKKVVSLSEKEVKRR